ncbi:MAG: iron-containing alcohol dehydrogenase [Comamonas sp.]|nr:iron-containing alcohol dehydrogenase [Candidatus Comamonas equi]
MTPRSVSSPKKFLIGAGLFDQVGEYIAEHGDFAFFVADAFFMQRIETQTVPALTAQNIRSHVEQFQFECTTEEIARLTAAFQASGANVVVGVGGGKALDAAKAVAHACKAALLLVPTIASTDAPCTALAVVYKADGTFDHYLFLPHNPDTVLADTTIIAQAPARFFAAGVGDALATYFEARATWRSSGTNLILKRPSRTGLGLGEMCYDILRKNIDAAMDAVRNKAVTPALEETIEATIYLSGVGAEAAGVAAAHAINNGMAVVPALHNAQHGEKVAFGLLTQLVLENAPRAEIEEVIRIIKAAGLPLSLRDFGLTRWEEAEWRQVAKVACDKNDTMGNMGRPISEEEVYDAMVAADAMAERYHD